MICILALVCVCLQLSPAPMIDIISLIRPAEAYFKKKRLKPSFLSTSLGLFGAQLELNNNYRKYRTVAYCVDAG